MTAGKRDASWYGRPRDPGAGKGTDYNGKYHVNVGDSEYPTAACGPILTTLTLVDEADVPVEMRCQRPGCRGRW